ncbi:hypothetical protein PsYK624_109010 [Phanerochaete sordida]|uniref:C2H2-type domain-containing protein n=1 Tax=Phanerochaete sordida TaxID=48140 RepID=A0A9P3GGV0_9APHY|nr:hypothetical protein PsYK624_109010 [Phanerochaete sordida]
MLYACKWGPCPSTFPSRAAYIKHLNTQHLTDAALDRDVGFVEGRFHEWLRVTGRRGGTQSTADALPSRRVEHHSDASSASSSPSKPQAATARSKSVVQSSDSEDDLPVGRFKFKALSRRLNAPESSPTPPIPSVVPSPSPSALASRAQSHIPDLSATSPSLRSPDGSPRRARSHDAVSIGPSRKRRRLNDELSDEDGMFPPTSSVAPHTTANGHPASTNGGRMRSHSPPIQSDADSSGIIESQLTQDNISLADSEGNSSVSGPSGDQSPKREAEDATAHVHSSQGHVNLSLPNSMTSGHHDQAHVEVRSGTPSQHNAEVYANAGYRPQFQSGILDMSGGVNSQRPVSTPESTQSQTQPESQVSPWRSSRKSAELSQPAPFEPSQLQLLTQAPYHFPSQVSQESQS